MLQNLSAQNTQNKKATLPVVICAKPLFGSGRWQWTIPDKSQPCEHSTEKKTYKIDFFDHLLEMYNNKFY